MILRNRIILAVLSYWALSSCVSLKQENYYGVYEYKSKISQGTLELRDSVFIFSYEAPMNHYVSKGHWSIKNKGMILKSYEIYKNNYMLVEEKSDSPKKTLQLVDSDNLPVAEIDIIINSDAIYKTDNNGRVDLSSYNTKINTIEVQFIDLLGKERVYRTKNNESNSFLIKVFPNDYAKKYFNNDTLKISRRKILIENLEYKKIK